MSPEGQKKVHFCPPFVPHFVPRIMPKREKPLGKSPVKLRFKKLTNGNKSLYLDIYDGGKRKKEYLKLYLLPDKDGAARERNEKTLELANAIKTERLLHLQQNRNSFLTIERRELSIPFADYMAGEIKRMEQIRTVNYVRRYRTGETWVRRYDAKTPLGSIDKKWIQGFIHFLSTTTGNHGRRLNQNTVHEYLIYIANILNNAVREGIIPTNPTKMLQSADRPRKYESKRDYLTMEELKRMMDVPCPERYNNIRGAFLFACFCGLRYSDLEQLRWKHIRKTEEGYIHTSSCTSPSTLLCCLPLLCLQSHIQHNSPDFPQKAFALCSATGIFCNRRRGHRQLWYCYRCPFDLLFKGRFHTAWLLSANLTLTKMQG